MFLASRFSFYNPSIPQFLNPSILIAPFHEWSAIIDYSIMVTVAEAGEPTR